MSSPPAYDFRIEFLLPGDDHINIEGDELTILEEQGGRRLRLTSGQSHPPAAKGVRALLRFLRLWPRRPPSPQSRGRANILRGGPYPTPQEALESANRAREGLLTWALLQQIGIDLGQMRPKSVLTNYGKEFFEKQLGMPIRQAKFGVDVFPHQEGLRFLRFDMKGSIGKSSENFRNHLSTAFTGPSVLTNKQALAAEIYCLSFFDISPRSRFVTIVSGVEALLEPALRQPEAQELVSRMKEMVGRSQLAGATKDSMVGSLQYMNRESIRNTGKKAATTLLADRQYLGKAAPQFFSDCYDIRSQILHSGSPENAALDILSVANACQRFLRDLLVTSSMLRTEPEDV